MFIIKSQWRSFLVPHTVMWYQEYEVQILSCQQKSSSTTFSYCLYFQSGIWLEVSMCGHFAQSMTREDYLALLADESERDIPYDPEPIGRFNVAQVTKVLLLSERDEQLHLDPVIWGYAPGWWDKPPLINARSETAATSRMFKLLCSCIEFTKPVTDVRCQVAQTSCLPPSFTRSVPSL